MHKGLGYTLIILLGIVAVGISGGLAYLIKSGKSFNFNLNIIGFGYSKTLVESKEYDKVKDINIDNKTADIFVETNDEDKVLVEIYSDNEKKHEISENEETINVLFDTKPTMGITKQSKIIVKVPSTYEKKFSVYSTTSDIKLDNFENMNFFAKLSTGDIDGTDLKEAEIKVTTGDINLKNVKNISYRSTTGDVNIESADNAKIKSTTGNISIKNINSSIDIDNRTGDVNINKANIVTNSSISLTTGDVRIKELTGAYIDTESKTGDIKVNNNDRKSDNEIKIKTTTGDIIVNR